MRTVFLFRLYFIFVKLCKLKEPNLTIFITVLVSNLLKKTLVVPGGSFYPDVVFQVPSKHPSRYEPLVSWTPWMYRKITLLVDKFLKFLSRNYVRSALGKIRMYSRRFPVSNCGNGHVLLVLIVFVTALSYVENRRDHSMTELSERHLSVAYICTTSNHDDRICLKISRKE